MLQGVEVSPLWRAKDLPQSPMAAWLFLKGSFKGFFMYSFKQALSAAIIFAAKNDIRYYLNGIKCTDTEVVATNGKALIVIEAKIPVWARGKIIDRESVVALNKLKVIIDSESTVEAFAKVNGIFPKFLKGEFPDFNKVINKDAPNKSWDNFLDIRYHYDAVMALVKLGSRYKTDLAEVPFTRHGDNHQAQYSCHGVQIVIMPITCGVKHDNPNKR